MFLNLIINDWCSFFTINSAGYNVFNGSFPSELGLLTELTYLSLGKWKYLVDHLDCLRVSCITNHNLGVFESHYK